jgi:hypothetical protein
LDIDWGLDNGQDRTHMINVFTDLQRMVTSNVSSATITVIEKGNGPGHGFCFVEVRLLEARQVLHCLVLHSFVPHYKIFSDSAALNLSQLQVHVIGLLAIALPSISECHPDAERHESKRWN